MKTNGPGKYDDICTIARKASNATAAIVIIIGGEHGGGFAVQTQNEDVIRKLPELLEEIAASIRRENDLS